MHEAIGRTKIQKEILIFYLKTTAEKNPPLHFFLSQNWQTIKNTSANCKQKEFGVSVFRLIIESSQVKGNQLIKQDDGQYEQ